MTVDAAYLVVGIGLLLAVALPTLLQRWAFSAPMALVATGLAVGLLPPFHDVRVSPLEHPTLTEHASELCIIVALMGVGLALDRPLGRTRASWRAWRSTWRLLLVAMPLCIAAVAFLGWWVMALPPAAALLLGSALAPTDPVLAADVQVSGPTLEEEEHIDENDDVRFALTSEGGLNDALAFPFVYAAMFLASKGPVSEWWLEWLSWELFGKVLIGIATGYVGGMLLGKLAFRGEPRVFRFAEQGEPLLALAGTLAVYGLTELVGGWGFLAVFVAAMRLRSEERHDDYQGVMHELVERLELLLTLLLLLALGIALSDGLLSHLTWQGALVAVLLVFVVRPVTAWLALGRQSSVDADGTQSLGPRERLVTAFFGVRGIGSIYYIAYALQEAHFPQAELLWSTVGFTIVLSVVVHGVAATPAMRWLEKVRERTPVPTAASAR
ncbi:cation:proton antiporter [Mobilicoccus pelagius]|uniref:Cation/H+ exchanger transmembrane domain-containing protein n=1 Tax=Mobilicoccus pelagius NBRC 104925 TaxID=1089455 RepID=H5UUK2_9MICO|nr:cation:proton antiporter [Mobilicoccus pelagius]GAB49410.1 hypothetical protein MOPEL_130_00170 [Mobilicoccus pelagius NBRC 104925]